MLNGMDAPSFNQDRTVSFSTRKPGTGSITYLDNNRHVYIMPADISDQVLASDETQ